MLCCYLLQFATFPLILTHSLIFRAIEIKFRKMFGIGEKKNPKRITFNGWERKKSTIRTGIRCAWFCDLHYTRHQCGKNNNHSEKRAHVPTCSVVHWLAINQCNEIRNTKISLSLAQFRPPFKSFRDLSWFILQIIYCVVRMAFFFHHFSLSLSLSLFIIAWQIRFFECWQWFNVRALFPTKATSDFFAF